MNRLLIVSFLALTCLAGSPLLAAEPADLELESHQDSRQLDVAPTPVEAVSSPTCIATAPVSKASSSGPAGINPGTSSLYSCSVEGQVRYVETEFCCSNGKLLEIKQTCRFRHLPPSGYYWNYSGSFCIGLFCNGSPV
ncbi:MAG: hypothetical protein K0U98_11060 [Deltaproteobacteria bacterium]|nr:hypothetical protein [Deltaproteobacteria bacterium]